MGTTAPGESKAAQRLVPALCAIAALALSPMPAPADATRSASAAAVSAHARHRALQAYRRHRTDAAYRPRRRHHERAPHARAAVVGGAEATIAQIPWQAAVFAEFEAGGNCTRFFAADRS
jgi:hypothetical protein